MKKLYFLLIILSVLVLGGCAKKMTVEEQQEWLDRGLQASTQHYSGFTEEQLALATQKVLYLIDPSDIGIIYNKGLHRVIGARIYMQYLVFMNIFGSETWVIDFKKTAENEYDVSIMLGLARDGGILATMPRGASPNAMHISTNHVDEYTAKLFFSRLDYFLGKSSKWISCEEACVTVPSSKPIPFLCGSATFGVSDKDPSYLDTHSPEPMLKY